MAEAQPAAPDTTVIVTGETMQAFTEARMAGEEFKPEAPAPAAKPADESKPVEAVAEDDPAHAAPVETENAVQEDGIWKAKPDKPLSKKQIEANERFSKLTQERNAANERAAAKEREIDALRAKYEPPAQIPQTEPDPTQYEDAKVYAEDYSNWKDGQRRQAEAQAAEQRQKQATQARFEADREKFKATVTDWDARAQTKANVQMNAEVIDAIMESDFPAQIFYELTPDDAVRINNLPTMRARLREINRMEAKIAAGSTAAPAAAASTVELSKAPPPINPLKGNAPAVTNRVDKDGNYTGSQEQYEKDRREGKLH